MGEETKAGTAFHPGHRRPRVRPVWAVPQTQTSPQPFCREEGN